jgi:serine/threonine-protein kinase
MASDLEARLREELTPQFELIRSLGVGSTAEVFLAREPILERLVAIKVLRPDIVSDPVAQRRFAREAQAVARISHPNVTSIHRVGTLSDDLPYIVMEYVDGRTLGERVDATGPLRPDVGATLLAGLASALDAAHDQGIVHRDVRPANIMIEKRTERAVLADFGIAALVESGADASARLTATGVRLGDLRYMSPEQVQGDRPTEQSDIYAFGIVAYIALAGRFPFDAEGPAQLAAAHLQGQPIPLRSLNPQIDPKIATLVERCLAKEPRRRPRAAELAKGLLLGASGPGVAHGPHDPGTFGAFGEELKRRSVYRAAATYAGVLLGVITISGALESMDSISQALFNYTVVALLAGFPIVLALSWLYDFRDGTASRTEKIEGEAPTASRLLPLVALALSIVASGLIGWFMLVGPLASG